MSMNKPATLGISCILLSCALLAYPARAAQLEGKPSPLPTKPVTLVTTQSGTNGSAKVSPYARFNRQRMREAESSAESTGRPRTASQAGLGAASATVKNR